MSAHYVQFVPTDRMRQFEDEKITPAMEYLKQIVEADEIYSEQSDLPEPYGLTSFDTIHCPHCGSEIDIAIWIIQMDRHYEESHFANLDFTPPCCEKAAALDQLQYNGTVAFACFCITVYNPFTQDFNWQTITTFLETWLGCPFTQVEYRI